MSRFPRALIQGLREARWGPVFLVGSLVLHLAWALADGYRLLTWFPTDDAFYYFVIARNILAGRGVTFDGLGPTNGFHPLWMLLLLPLFLLEKFGPLVPLRAVVVLAGFLHGLTGWLLYRAARQVLQEPLAVGLAASWTFGLLPWRFTVVGGMESSLNALGLVVLWTAALNMHRQQAYLHPSAGWRLGAAMAFAFLARLDSILVIAGFGIWWLWQAWHRASGSPGERIQRVARGLVPVVTPGLVFGGAYLAWNVVYVGSPVPISARMKVLWGQMGPSPYGRPYGGNLVARTIKSLFDPSMNRGPWAYAMLPITRIYQRLEPRLFPDPEHPGLALRVALVYTPFLALAALVLALTRQRWMPDMSRAVLWPWLLGALIHGLYYDYTNHMAQRFWYWVPQMLFTHIFLALWLQGLLKPRRLPAALAPLFILAFALPFFPKAWPRPAHRPWQEHLYVDYARWIEAHTEPGSTIAATGAGSLAYFVRGRHIVSLDGLVGSAAYLEAVAQGRRAQYWAAHGLDYIMITPGMLRNPIYGALEPYLEGMDWYRNPEEGWAIKMWRFHKEAVP